jgi:hypothetical protein
MGTYFEFFFQGCWERGAGAAIFKNIQEQERFLYNT